ncbi:transglycosylase SLT domain-containing protein [Streptomyces sp. NPDC048297]|uniref:transglycosylase SLT domain-containing protein n=1 Tax=Streptomyces sp. NPDC048297 TaxID=3365531 RepID=UPI003722F9E7
MTRTRFSRLRTLALTGIATTGAATAALTLMPTAAQAAEPVHAKTTAVTSESRDLVKAHGYANNLDGWIKQSLDIMKSKKIPGSYDGLKRNIMRESSGNPNAQNNWDINARNGIPSKGLLQVIQPTFNAYHVEGTSHSITDPVANITAAANYAAHRYGSIDNVNSAY